jgi:hypothetical protein
MIFSKEERKTEKNKKESCFGGGWLWCQGFCNIFGCVSTIFSEVFKNIAKPEGHDLVLHNWSAT